MTAGARPVLVVGLPRSGTTWVMRVLSSAPGTRMVREPDNEKISAAALAAKRRLGRFPVLDRDDPTDPAYDALWSWALSGAPTGRLLARAGRWWPTGDVGQAEAAVRCRPPARGMAAAVLAGRGLRAWAGGGGPQARPPRRSTSARGLRAARVTSARVTSAMPGPEDGPERPVVKSVHAVLSAEWVAARHAVDVVVVLRHPAGVVASWMGMDFADRDRRLDRHPVVRRRLVERWGVPLPGSSALERASWQAGLMTAALEEVVERNPAWHVCVHDDLCLDPTGRFNDLFDRLGLGFGPSSARRLAEDDRPGSGYTPRRVAAEVPGQWRALLTPEEIAVVRDTVTRFPLRRWVPEDFTAPASAG